MKKIIALQLIVILTLVCFNSTAAEFEKDIFDTSKGELAITFIEHGTLMMEFDGKVIHINPVGRYADYSTLPKADLILVTHEHGDHLDLNAIELISKSTTNVVLTKTCTSQYESGKVMANGESATIQGLKIEAVPAYNIEKAFHPKGVGNGYVITCGDKKVYIAGDTENVPEMAELKNIEIAFLPMNLPYTMTPEMVAESAKAFKPKILYPYHFGNTNTDELVELMKDVKDVEVWIRKLQ
ncbi:MAG: MBL fold metallo-hydrolase [Mariniphaga sp.]|nr:MBL fold metallo-hydrolase [Mariniphaga sp.]